GAAAPDPEARRGSRDVRADLGVRPAPRRRPACGRSGTRPHRAPSLLGPLRRRAAPEVGLSHPSQGGSLMRTQTLLSLVVAVMVLALAAPVTAQAPAPPPEYGTPLNLEQAKKIMAGAEAEAVKNKWGMVITIVDSGGNAVMMHRLDNTQF